MPLSNKRSTEPDNASTGRLASVLKSATLQDFYCYDFLKVDLGSDRDHLLSCCGAKGVRLACSQIRDRLIKVGISVVEHDP